MVASIQPKALLTTKPTMRRGAAFKGGNDSLTLIQERLFVEVEVLAFLAEILDGGGDPLNLSPDARAGFSTILGGVAASVTSIAGKVDTARGMLPDSEPAQ
ncbi:hypothetical protein LJC15_02295 [Desulfovibrio sp. OttesenSCG-928-G11]|nr:hypothetical protein [Desulfovibrio sp. OttesenSCG-928-G11]